MSDDCTKCLRLVRSRQEAMQCSTCERWTHRTCGTGISRQLYRRLVRDNQEVDWWCDECGAPDGVEPENPSDVSLDESEQPDPVPAPRIAPVPAPRIAPVPAPRTAPVPAPRTAPVPAPRIAPIPAPRTAPVPAPRASSPAAVGDFHISFNLSDVSLEEVEIHNES